MLDAACFSGAGNRFLLLDCRARGLPEASHEFTRTLCGRDAESSSEFTSAFNANDALDGVIFILQPSECGDVKMVIHNADGSRPEICGNGMHCLGLWASEEGSFSDSGLQVETDAGPRWLQFEPTESGGLLVHVNMGSIQVADQAETLQVLGQPLKLTVADVGNPHAVLLVDDLVEARVEAIGAALQVHERFPAGVNVHFTRVDLDEVSVRVYERGVGETLACGSGACAVAGVLRFHGGPQRPVRIRMSGGVLNVQQDAKSCVWLSGQARRHHMPNHVLELLERAGQRAQS